MVRTKERARLCVYWSGIDNDIQNLVLSCKTCQDLLPSNPQEPMITKSPPADHSEKWLATFAPTPVISTSSLYTATRTGQRSYQWKARQQPHSLSLLLEHPSAVQEYPTRSGRMEGHSLHPNSSKTSQSNGVSDTQHRPPSTRRAMAKWKPP